MKQDPIQFRTGKTVEKRALRRDNQSKQVRSRVPELPITNPTVDGPLRTRTNREEQPMLFESDKVERNYTRQILF